MKKLLTFVNSRAIITFVAEIQRHTIRKQFEQFKNNFEKNEKSC